MSEDQYKRFSGDFVAQETTVGTYYVTIGDTMDAIVGTIRPDGDRWEAVRHRPITNHAGGVYNHLPPIVLGSSPTVEAAMRFFDTPIDPMQLAYIQDEDTGQPLCPIDGSELGGRLATDRDALVLMCTQCEYVMRLPFAGGALPQ